MIPPASRISADLVALVAVQIVVAEHGDRRQRHVAELVDHHADLVDRPAPCEIPGQQQEVGLHRRGGEGRPDDTAHIGADVDVADGGDGDAHPGAEVAPDVVRGETRPGRSGDLLVERVHDAVRHDEVARLRVEQQAQDAARALASPEQQIVPVDLVGAGVGEDREGVVPVARGVLVVHHRLDHHEVLAGDDWYLDVAERVTAHPALHLVVEEHPRRLEDDVDLHVVVEGLEDPLRVGLFRRHAAVAEGGQDLRGVVGSTEHVDVVRPSWATVRGRGHTADERPRQPGTIEARGRHAERVVEPSLGVERCPSVHGEAAHLNRVPPKSSPQTRPVCVRCRRRPI